MRNSHPRRPRSEPASPDDGHRMPGATVTGDVFVPFVAVMEVDGDFHLRAVAVGIDLCNTDVFPSLDVENARESGVPPSFS